MLRALATVLCLLAGIVVAHAEALNYDYVYFSHAETDTNGESASNDAYGGYWEFTKTLHLLASYGDAGFYGAGLNNANSSAYRLGIGGHYLLGDNTMIAPEIAVIQAEYDWPTQPAPGPSPTYVNRRSDTGYAVIIDMRHRFFTWLEVVGSARYTHVFDNGESSFVLGPVFHVNKHLALGALYQTRNNTSGWEATVRWYY